MAKQLKNPQYTGNNPAVKAAKAKLGKRATVVHSGTYGATTGTAGTGHKAKVQLAPTGIVCWVGNAPKQSFKRPRGLKKANVVHKLASQGATVKQVRAALKTTKYKHASKGMVPVGANLNWLIAHGYVAVVQAQPAIAQRG